MARLPRRSAACNMTVLMECQCLAPGEVPHTTKLHSAYLESDERVTQFFAHPPAWEAIAAAASAAQIASQTRAAVVAALRDQNGAYGADASVESNLDRLAAGSAAIVTGQQVGLFTGPAYSLYKALTAIRVAAEMTQNGIDAVPVFWLATEDHDLDEVNHCFWPSRGGLLRLENPPGEAAGRSVGEVALGEGIREIVRTASETLEGPSSG